MEILSNNINIQIYAMCLRSLNFLRIQSAILCFHKSDYKFAFFQYTDFPANEYL